MCSARPLVLVGLVGGGALVSTFGERPVYITGLLILGAVALFVAVVMITVMLSFPGNEVAKAYGAYGERYSASSGKTVEGVE